VHSQFGCNNYLQAKDIEMVNRFARKLLSLAFVVSGVASAQGVPAGLTPVDGTSRPLSHTAQSAPPRKDIPTIAKAANGAIVTIVTAANDKPIALGTGFLVSPDGVIVTNYHVIKTGNVAVVKFPDGTILPVDGVLAIDKVRDLAIIKIHGKSFPTLTLGNSDQIQVGEEVVAIGNPLGLELTVSNGILSGIRSDEKEDGKLLQITAPISRGSSGGPLFNMFGEVVGINVMFLEGGESLNFAIPVNDAKNLLQKQSAQLQQLPNESDTDRSDPNSRTPNGSSGLSSDASSPREKESGVITAKGNQSASYFVQANEHGYYTIKYAGRQFLVTCRETLTWLQGIDQAGESMGDGCTYMQGLVGKRIPADLMWQQNKELRYQPWLGQDTAQTADVLDIIAEGPVGSPLRRSSPRTSPEILKTLRWIQNTLEDREGNIVFAEKDGNSGTRVNLLPDVNGCEVTFAHMTLVGAEWKQTFHARQRVNLGDLDPTSLKVNTFVKGDVIGPANPDPDSDAVPGDDAARTVSIVTVHTTDKVPAVGETVNDRNWRTGMPLQSTDLSWELPAPYGARFAKALRQTITLCGGRRSSF
jgi:S1-C subfamily serine protease